MVRKTDINLPYLVIIIRNSLGPRWGRTKRNETKRNETKRNDLMSELARTRQDQYTTLSNLMVASSKRGLTRTKSKQDYEHSMHTWTLKYLTCVCPLWIPWSLQYRTCVCHCEYHYHGDQICTFQAYNLAQRFAKTLICRLTERLSCYSPT